MRDLILSASVTVDGFMAGPAAWPSCRAREVAGSW
jgi:hypothetical protein